MFFDCDHNPVRRADFLFNQEEYLLQQNKPFCSAYIDGSDALLCRITALDDGHYVSGYHATYGGIEGTSVGSLDAFIKNMLSQLKEKGARSFTLRQVPFFYSNEFYGECHRILMDNGFELQVSEKNQYLNVHKEIPFDTGIAYEKRRILNKLKETGAECRLFNHAPGPQWYSLFQQARSMKGFPLTLTQSEYERITESIPGVYTHAGVFIKDLLVAAAIVVQVSRNSMYYFFAASDANYNALSPSVLIVEEMYQMAIRNQCSVIDMGISSLNGIVNNGLFFFKKELGAKESIKNTYSIHF